MATTTEAPSSAAPAAPEAAPNRRPLFVLLFLVVAVGGAFTARSVMTADQQNTDDAQIDADVIPLAARVAGLVTSVKVVENQAVKKGQVLARLEPELFNAALAQSSASERVAEANVARAKALLADSERKLARAAATRPCSPCRSRPP